VADKAGTYTVDEWRWGARPLEAFAQPPTTFCSRRLEEKEHLSSPIAGAMGFVEMLFLFVAGASHTVVGSFAKASQ
jgi:hypothetical protein